MKVYCPSMYRAVRAEDEKVTFLFSPINMSRIPVNVPLKILLFPRNITSSGIRISPSEST